jgi:hypothetical protein
MSKGWEHKMTGYLSKINPFYKCAGVIVFSIALAFTSSTAINTGVFFACIILLATGSNRVFLALKAYASCFDYGGGPIYNGRQFWQQSVIRLAFVHKAYRVFWVGHGFRPDHGALRIYEKPTERHETAA